LMYFKLYLLDDSYVQIAIIPTLTG
jgi:hypothetical protein